MRAPCLLSALAFFPAFTSAVQQPATNADGLIGYIDYRPDQVIQVAVQRGTATRIVLADDEHILRDGAATGYAADCSKPEYAWCMHADQGSNQVLVRPKEGATVNNLELRTDKRDYSFRFVVADALHPGRRARKAMPNGTPLYRVIFRYPGTGASATAVPPTQTAAELIRTARPHPRNWQYSMQIMAGSEDIVPSLVFDDGHFTYFQFPANREMPTIFVLSSAREEARVNFHIDEHDPGLVVVERMGRQFVLRLGDAVVGIWNDAYDSYGIPPHDGTTVEGVTRTMR